MFYTSQARTIDDSDDEQVEPKAPAADAVTATTVEVAAVEDQQQGQNVSEDDAVVVVEVQAGKKGSGASQQQGGAGGGKRKKGEPPAEKPKKRERKVRALSGRSFRFRWKEYALAVFLAHCMASMPTGTATGGGYCHTEPTLASPVPLLRHQGKATGGDDDSAVANALDIAEEAERQPDAVAVSEPSQQRGKKQAAPPAASSAFFGTGAKPGAQPGASRGRYC